MPPKQKAFHWCSVIENNVLFFTWLIKYIMNMPFFFVITYLNRSVVSDKFVVNWSLDFLGFLVAQSFFLRNTEIKMLEHNKNSPYLQKKKKYVPRVNQHQWRNDLSFQDESIKSVFSSKDVDRYEVVPLLLSYQMPYIIDARRPSFFRQAFQSVRSKEQIRWRHLLDIQLYDKWNGRKDALGNFRQYANQFDRR